MFGTKEALLHDAVREGDVAKVGELLDQGADINAKDKHGDAPLHKAALRHVWDVAELLIARGAVVNELNKYGQTPLDVAGHKSEFAVFLRSKGGKPCKELIK
jgi:ankyrin repeat protein